MSKKQFRVRAGYHSFELLKNDEVVVMDIGDPSDFIYYNEYGESIKSNNELVKNIESYAESVIDEIKDKLWNEEDISEYIDVEDLSTIKQEIIDSLRVNFSI